MFLHRIALRNILSFGPDRQELPLAPLNVLIGPNGSGKSNLIDAIGLLRAAPTDITTPIRESDGVADWIWHGEPNASSARIDVDVDNPADPQPLRYGLEFAEQGQSFQILNERLATAAPVSGDDKPWVCFEADSQHATVYRRETDNGGSKPSGIDFAGHESVLALLKNPNVHPRSPDSDRGSGACVCTAISMWDGTPRCVCPRGPMLRTTFSPRTAGTWGWC